MAAAVILEFGGHLTVMEVWDTPQHQGRFMEERLGEALAKGRGHGTAFERDRDRARCSPQSRKLIRAGYEPRPPLPRLEKMAVVEGLPVRAIGRLDRTLHACT